MSFHVQDKILLWKWNVNQKNYLLRNRFSKWSLHSNTLEKLLLQNDKKIISFWENINNLKDLGWNPSLEESIRQILFCEINLWKWKQDVDALQRFLLQKEEKMISLCENINCSKMLLFIHRNKSFWRSVRLFFWEICISKLNPYVISSEKFTL